MRIFSHKQNCSLWSRPVQITSLECYTVYVVHIILNKRLDSLNVILCVSMFLETPRVQYTRQVITIVIDVFVGLLECAAFDRICYASTLFLHFDTRSCHGWARSFWVTASSSWMISSQSRTESLIICRRQCCSCILLNQLKRPITIHAQHDNRSSASRGRLNRSCYTPSFRFTVSTVRQSSHATTSFSSYRITITRTLMRCMPL